MVDPELESVQEELEALRRENESLRKSAQGVAEANARAAELLTDYSQERDRLRQRIEQSQRLESLGLLAGGIAHDFNNLLQAIGGFTEIAMRVRPGESSKWLQQVVETTQHASELCNQLLSFAGKGPGEKSPLELVELVQGLRGILEVACGSASLDLRLSEAPAWILGDTSQIRQILLNLVTNAGEAMNGAGTVVVEVREVECDEETLSRTVLAERLPAGRYVSLRVSDPGCGLDPGQLRRIFDPFYSSKNNGRGLGLSVVLGVVRAHRGAMIVSSEPGEGTSFELLFPPGPGSKAEAGGQAVVRDEAKRSGTLLLVDDDDRVREGAAELLRLAGYTVLEASSGKVALETYDREKDALDCVVLDVSMPERDGVEVFTALRERGTRVPVLFASGCSPVEVEERLARLGSTDTFFLQKPYESNELIDRIEALRASD